MRPLASAPLAAPRPRRSEAEAFWNSLGRDLSITGPQSVPAFLLQTPGGTLPLRRKSLVAASSLVGYGNGTGRS